MTTQPEDLRLADALEDDLVGHDGLSIPRLCQDIADKAASALRRLHAENEALRADAERYRWLRSRLRDDNYSPYYIRVDEDNAPQEISRSWWALGGNMLDADIDAAIDAAKERT